MVSAPAAGYDVYAVCDASDCWDMMSEQTSCMLQWDGRRPSAAGTLKHVFGGRLPFYEWLSNNQAATTAATRRSPAPA